MVFPNVVTSLKYDEFTLEILAYRKPTKAEINLSVSIYLQQKRRKTFPKKGNVKLITTIGLS